MDLQMPVVDGLQLLSQLASDQCTANIILVSGVGDSVVNAARRVGTARGLNVTAALAKPFSAAELAGVLKSNRMEDPWLSVASFSDAMNREEFYLLYQPKVDLRTGVVSGAEALVRWRHPMRGVIAPLEFIPFAESSACIDRMTQWIGTTACGQMQTWDAAGCRSAYQCLGPQPARAAVVDQLASQCRVAAFAVAPHARTHGNGGVRDAVQMMMRTRLQGSTRHDDFGTGHSRSCSCTGCRSADRDRPRSSPAAPSESRSIVRSGSSSWRTLA
jgi:CheY-like chemotaxis protein